MPFKFVAPLEKEFVLERADEKYGTDGTPTVVTIRQATQRQHELRSALFADITQVFDRSNEVKQQWRWSFQELMRYEAFLTLVGANITDDHGRPLFRFKNSGGKQVLDMSDKEFNEAWGNLPPDVAAEMHEKVLEVNLEWGGPLQ